MSMVERYYMVQGPEKFEETPECAWWLNSCHWAKDVVVIYAEHQDNTKLGQLFKIVYKPKSAPEFKYLRMPMDWVIEIPCFKHIPYEQEEQWILEKSRDGKITVVRR